MVLEEGVYEIPDDCTVYVVKRKINVVKKKIKTQPNLKRCRDCVHCKSGRQRCYYNAGKKKNPLAELDEKIKLVKERGTWDGVDVDKYIDELRGR